MGDCLTDVHFTPKSGHCRMTVGCPLSAISGLMHRSKELSLFEARSCVDELGHPSKLPLRLEAQPGNAGCAVVRFGSTRSENDA
jgi:hypothetical protein